MIAEGIREENETRTKNKTHTRNRRGTALKTKKKNCKKGAVVKRGATSVSVEREEEMKLILEKEALQDELCNRGSRPGPDSLTTCLSQRQSETELDEL
ncbi:hypothetical protein LSTR_LSTR017320 [Laodelphax striatellus]|uniref:Uncharacterized protein n=1 Tax=Laodelphax striatellus TaxID=195883 RepID=A0A482WUQ1_LAOST|nr:hypothetical protein LSTR_LSTR017320 [Laodelphax striatellus]